MALESQTSAGWSHKAGVLVLPAALIILTGCAAGPAGPFSAADPAGFWAGLWHGFIAWITFILSLFTSVKIYAVHNTGWPYDLGFIIGMAIWLGGGGSSYGCSRGRRDRRDDADWDQIAAKVEAKVKRDLRVWAEAGEEAEWSEVERKVEDKVKRKIREWADS